MTGYWDDRRSDPNGQNLILAIEPNGAPPGQALSKILKNRWYVLRDAVRGEIIRGMSECRCEKCGIRVEREHVSNLHVHEHWYHTDDKTLLDPYFELICADCHNVRELSP